MKIVYELLVTFSNIKFREVLIIVPIMKPSLSLLNLTIKLCSPTRCQFYYTSPRKCCIEFL